MVNRILLLYQLAGGSLLQHCCGVQQLHQAPRKKESLCNQLAVSACSQISEGFGIPGSRSSRLKIHSFMPDSLPVTQMSSVLGVESNAEIQGWRSATRQKRGQEQHKHSKKKKKKEHFGSQPKSATSKLIPFQSSVVWGELEGKFQNHVDWALKCVF